MFEKFLEKLFEIRNQLPLDGRTISNEFKQDRLAKLIKKVLNYSKYEFPKVFYEDLMDYLLEPREEDYQITYTLIKFLAVKRQYAMLAKTFRYAHDLETRRVALLQLKEIVLLSEDKNHREKLYYLLKKMKEKSIDIPSGLLLEIKQISDIFGFYGLFHFSDVLVAFEEEKDFVIKLRIARLILEEHKHKHRHVSDEFIESLNSFVVSTFEFALTAYRWDDQQEEPPNKYAVRQRVEYSLKCLENPFADKLEKLISWYPILENSPGLKILFIKTIATYGDRSFNFLLSTLKDSDKDVQTETLKILRSLGSEARKILPSLKEYKPDNFKNINLKNKLVSDLERDIV